MSVLDSRSESRSDPRSVHSDDNGQDEMEAAFEDIVFVLAAVW